MAGSRTWPRPSARRCSCLKAARPPAPRPGPGSAGLPGLDRVGAFDMGGTTAKLALVDDGEPLVAWGFEAARQKRFLRGSGLPIQIATVELIEIGTGAGATPPHSE